MRGAAAVAIAVALAVALAGSVHGQSSRWSGTFQTGLAEKMQLSLGGTFKRGPALQNRLTVTRTGLLGSRDSLQFYGWSTSDLRSASLDSDTGVRYRAPVRRIGGYTVVAGSGLEFWSFPSVLGGTKDVVLDTYGAVNGGEKIPWSISANGKTLLRSDLPRGTFVILQAQGTNKLGRWGSRSLSVQHGPVYVYSRGVYGRNGHRVLRYAATAQFGGPKWGLEAMFRPQAGLQPGIPDNRFWSVGVVRRFSL